MTNENEEIEGSHFKNVINNPFAKIILNYFPKICFVIANILIFLILITCFDFNDIYIKINYAWILFMAGIAFSLIVIKPEWILSFRKLIKEKRDSPKKEELQEQYHMTKFGYWNALIITIRSFFFNIFNDLFILTIIWVSLFGFILLCVQYLNIDLIITNFEFNKFISIVTELGILSGFIQIYISYHKETIYSKISRSLTKYIQKTVENINTKDFIGYLKSKHSNNEITREVETFANDKDNILRRLLGKINLPGGIRSGRLPQINIYSLSPGIKLDTISFFIYMEQHLLDTIPSLKIQDLNKIYTEYFNLKYKEFQENLKKLDMAEVQKIIFSNIVFFDEALAELTRIEFEGSYKIESPLTFADHYNAFIEKCIYYTADIMLKYQ